MPLGLPSVELAFCSALRPAHAVTLGPAHPRPPPPPCRATQPLVELHIFAGAQRVVEALRAHDCGLALAWCEEHRARLRKARSRLEFKLRVQVGPVLGLPRRG